MRGKIKAAMTYPVVVFGFSMMMLIALLMFVLPKFKGIFETMGLKLPLTTSLLLNFSSNVQHYWYVAVVLVVGSVVGIKVGMRTEKGRYLVDAAKLKLPIFGDLILKTGVARFAPRTFGTLISSGVPVLRALEIVGDTAGNRVLSGHGGSGAGEHQRRGQNQHAALQQQVFPVMVTQMIAVGRERAAGSNAG